MMRHKLIAVVGATPQILTETLWALRVDRGIPVDEVHVLTTVLGRRVCRERLFEEGRFGQFLADNGISYDDVLFDDAHILVFEDADGNPLEDIRSSLDNQQARDAVYGLVEAWTREDDVALHCSLAGGRKSMGFLLGSAVHFFGRPQDRLYHVLVSPPQVERPDATFYYPPPAPRPILIAGPDRRQPEALKVDGREVSTADVSVELAEIPFCRLREVVQFVAPGRYDEEALSLTQRAINDYAEAMRQDYVQKAKASAEDAFPEIVGRSSEVRDLKHKTQTVADYDVPILIAGPSGSGKELVAAAIHKASRRAGGKFVPQNCGSISPSLAASHLFGHERGAFTDARTLRRGLFEQAHGGTLFLDEIDALPPEVQVMLLRVLEEGKVTRVGAEEGIEVDVRVIVATNRDLESEVEQDRFRRDLYMRLGFRLHVPSLGERREDIPLLAQHFLEEFEERAGKRWQGITPEALLLLQQHAWPGNVRELRNCVESAAMFTPVDEWIGAAGFLDTEMRVEPARLKEQMDRVEASLIRQALARHGGNRREAADELGMDRTNLGKKMKKLGIS